MLTLASEDITLAAHAKDKTDAIGQIVAAMVAADLVEPAYLQGMLAREEQTSTYLGHGIAIPHGTTDTRTLVKQTGLKVWRFPDGVAWGAGQTVFTAVGIAARSDEHLAILRQLTRVIGDEQLSARLHQCATAEEVRQILSGETASSAFLCREDLVRLQASTTSYAEAIGLAAALLWNQQALLSSELEALYARLPLHLGEGVWFSALATAAQHSALAVVVPQTPFALYGHECRLLFAITGRDTQHWPLLERLGQLRAAGDLGRLAHSRRALDLVRALVSADHGGHKVSCVLPMAHGLHARPAALLARLAKSWEGEFWVENLDGDSPAVSLRSVTKLLGLGAAFGHRLQITSNSPRADEALAALKSAIEGGLGDPVIPLPADHGFLPQPAADAPAPLQAGEVIQGLQGAPGIAIAPARQRRETTFDFPRRQGPATREIERLQQALGNVSRALQSQYERATNTELAQIIGMHLELLLDPEMRADAERHIATGDSAEWGWQQSFEALAELQAANTEVLLAERAIDIRDVGRRVLAALTGQEDATRLDEDHVLVCQEMAPSELGELDPVRVKAIVTAAGGVTSHAAILARSLGFPLLVACGPRVLNIADATMLIVDCEARQVTVAPDESTLRTAREAIAKEREHQAEAQARRLEPATTRDGHRVEVMANLTAAKAIDQAIDQGCEGVGLLRSEFIYMNHPQEPTVEEQRWEYARVLDRLGPDRPLIVRTLDIGGDKHLAYMPIEDEDNPFLGIRGVRLSLRYPAVLRNQLHALLQAAAGPGENSPAETIRPETSHTSAGRPLRIMFPMVTDILEWRRIKAIYEEVAADYPDVRVELGIMIEVPAAALMADVFAAELDFFSIGTNDLTQYTLAIDRGHPHLSRQADALSPAVLRLIDHTVKAATRHGIWVGVCGELAADPLGAEILTGLGVAELSLSVRAIPRIKAHLRGIALSEARELATRALLAESADAVRQLKPSRGGPVVGRNAGFEPGMGSGPDAGLEAVREMRREGGQDAHVEKGAAR